MNKHNVHLLHARSLQAAIMDSPAVWLPRRADLVSWLEGFIQRVTGSNYELGENEVSDLAALDKFLREEFVLVA